MDTTPLEAAYKQLLDVARGGSFPTGGTDAELLPDGDHPAVVLAGVVVTDRLLAQTTAELLAGARPSYTDAPASRLALLQEVVRAGDGVDGLVGEVRRGALVLVRLVRQLDDHGAATPVPTRLVDGDAVRLEAPMPWSGVLNTHAEVDLPARAERLEALRG